MNGTTNSPEAQQMSDETFARLAREEDSQPVNTGAIPVERCPACNSTDIGLNETENHRRYYCRICTTTWSPGLVQQARVTAPEAQPQEEAEKIDFSCRVCGIQCAIAPDPPERAVCPDHCEDHNYVYSREDRSARTWR
jgi:hypothetical protein